MGAYTELRIKFYEFATNPTQANLDALKEAEKEFEATYGASEVKKTLDEAQRNVEKLKVSRHLPYSRP